MKRILVVGAGFAGAVHARVLAEAGYDVDLIDQRPYLGGAAADYVDDNGLRIHRHGPHLFHTKISRVADWLLRFGHWVPYRHKARADLRNGAFVPVPINLESLSTTLSLDLATAEEANMALAELAQPVERPRNAAEYLNGLIGPYLADIFFRPYVGKMWGVELEDMDIGIVKRVSPRMNFDDEYWPDEPHQVLPRHGYSETFAEILDHPRIHLCLGQRYEKDMEKRYRHCFNSMSIDDYFDYRFGELGFRSIRFHPRTLDFSDERDWSVTVYTDDGPFIRETWWDLLPAHQTRNTGRRTVTAEEPCDYRDNDGERYYPIKDIKKDNHALYKRYRDELEAQPTVNMSFIGRCGTYQYLNMDQVINQSLVNARSWVKENA